MTAPGGPPADGLRGLVAAALGAHRPDLPDAPVSGVAQALERVRPGAVFVARVGRRVDAHDLVPQAIAAGAGCIVGSREGLTSWADTGVPYVRVDDDRWATSALAATFHGHPSRSLVTIGVTGTDGKTTTSTLLHHLFQADATGVEAGLLSSAGVRIGAEARTLPGHFTTPEATEVHEVLAAMRDAGARVAVVESSSHGFALQRLEHVHYEVGAWTTLTPEHLDDHGTLEAYLEAKRTLVRRARVSLLNRDDPHFGDFATAARRAVSYGEGEGADLRAVDVAVLPGELAFTVVAPDGARVPATLPMVGRFNVGNALAALGAAREAGLALEVAAPRLASFRGVPGRMELVMAEPFRLVVDFAHTPPALERALAALRPPGGGRRIVVIGAAGERDPGKRRPLGAVGVTHAELAIFTEEDHRSEDLGAILAAMAEGARAAGGRDGASFEVVPERRAAIAAAVARARPGDVVVLCGKGHERTLERGDETLPWDEAAEARSALREAGFDPLGVGA